MRPRDRFIPQMQMVLGDGAWFTGGTGGGGIGTGGMGPDRESPVFSGARRAERIGLDWCPPLKELGDGDASDTCSQSPGQNLPSIPPPADIHRNDLFREGPRHVLGVSWGELG
jgi:hypothetical protein